MHGNRGFTLIELVVVVTLLGVVSLLASQVLVGPVKSYLGLSDRLEVVDQATIALQRIQRDIRHALPNSVRVSSDGRYLEFQHLADGGRYRARKDTFHSGDILDFTAEDQGFDVLGGLLVDPQEGWRVVVYNTSTSGTWRNAYADSGNRAQVGSGSSKNHISFSTPFRFPVKSPFQRFFLVDEIVTYACENGQLNRYSGYSSSIDQPTPPAITPVPVSTVTSSCQFDYFPGVRFRGGFLSVRLNLNVSGETMTLHNQIHVVNAP